MVVGECADAGPQPDLLGQGGRFADEKIGVRQLVDRLEPDERAVLADPSLLDSQLIGELDLEEIFLVADPGHLVEALTIRKESDLHVSSKMSKNLNRGRR